MPKFITLLSCAMALSVPPSEVVFHERATLDRTTVATPISPKLVAEAEIRAMVAPNDINDEIYLPVTLHGHQVTVMLNLFGKLNLGLSPTKMEQIGIELWDTVALDSLAFGTVVERHLAVNTINRTFTLYDQPDLPPVIGLLNGILDHYDVVVDGPAHRVRLYLPPSNTSSSAMAAHNTWLPPGIRPKDCSRLESVAPGYFLFELQGGTHPLSAMFMEETWNKMNVAASKQLGLTPRSPNVHPLPDSVSERFDGEGNAVQEQATDLHLTLGKQPLTDVPVNIFPVLGGDDSVKPAPRIFLNFKSVGHQILFVSSRAGKVCLGQH